MNLIQVTIVVGGKVTVEQRLVASNENETYNELLAKVIGETSDDISVKEVIISLYPIKTRQVGLNSCVVTLNNPVGFSFSKKYEYCTFFANKPDAPDEGESRVPPVKNINDLLLQKVTLELIDPSKKGFNDFDGLSNEVYQYFTDLGFRFSRGNTRAKYFADRITSIIWGLALSDSRKKLFDDYYSHKSTKKLPKFLNCFKNYNDYQRKKQAVPRLCSVELRKWSEEILNVICPALIIKMTPTLFSDLTDLGEFIASVAGALDKQNSASKTNHATIRASHGMSKLKERPTLGTTHENIGYNVIEGSPEVKNIYKSLDEDVRDMPSYECLIFDEDRYFNEPMTKQERYNFFNGLQLSVNIGLVKIHLGGSMINYHGICRLPDDHISREHENLSAILQVIQEFVVEAPTFHTRAMKKTFGNLIGRVTNLKPFEERFLYKALTNDSSVDQNPELDGRLLAIAFADPADFELSMDDNPIDRRSLNQGRPKKFQEFLNVAKELIAAEYRAEDDRRGNEVGHLAKFVSLEDLHEQVKKEFEKQCSEKGLETSADDIPSMAWLRLQFVPGDAFSRSSAAYTGELDLTYAVQKRQLRKSHPDAHYCSALFKYWKEYAILLKGCASCLFLDDKAKVVVGEPGGPVSTGVRGRRSITKTNVDLESLDHDQNTKCSLTPSVILNCEIPESTSNSFYHGTASVCVKDTVLSSSNPFRHAIELNGYLSASSSFNPVLFLYTDGGVDHRCNLLSVKLSLIMLFKKQNLDFLCIARTAPNHSYLNPAERVMSSLNYGLQNCALERNNCFDGSLENDQGSLIADKTFKSSGGMDAMRQSMAKDPALKIYWKKSIEGPLNVVKSRFSRLHYSRNPITSYQEARDEDMDQWENLARTLFPDVPPSFTDMVENNLSKSKSLAAFLDSHCNSRTYHFEIRKCGNNPCEHGVCGELRLGIADFERVKFLPDPLVDPNNQEHYLRFQEIFGTDTNDDSRPSVIANDSKEVSNYLGSINWASENFVAQNARDVIKCSACKMTRVIYSKRKLKLDEKNSLNSLIATKSCAFLCGSQLTEDGDSIHGLVVLKIPMKCHEVIEKPYYSAKCFPQLCYYCGASDESIKTPEAWKRVYKSPFTACENCARDKPAAGSKKMTNPCFQKKRKLNN